MPQNITMYSTIWCADCRAAKRFLSAYNILYEEIDIDRDEEAAKKVVQWSGGRRVIPTFEIRCEKESDTPVILHNPPLKILAGTIGIRV